MNLTLEMKHSPVESGGDDLQNAISSPNQFLAGDWAKIEVSAYLVTYHRSIYSFKKFNESASNFVLMSETGAQ